MNIIFRGPIHVTVDIASLLQRLDGLDVKLNTVLAQGERVMADITLAKDALAALNSTTNALAAAVTSVVAADEAEDNAFRAEIQTLKDQIAAGGAISQADLDELLTGMGATRSTLEAVATALQSMGANPTQPIPQVDVPPVVTPPGDEV